MCDNYVEASSKKHWGEIPTEVSSLPVYDVSEDIAKSMDINCLNDYPDVENALQFDELTLPSMDPMMLYAIQLHKWTNDMTETIRLAELAVETNLIPSEDAKPPVPEMPEICVKSKPNILNFMETLLPCPSSKCEMEVPHLSAPIIKQLLIKCIATMTAHIGFESTYQSVLDVLVDVLEQFFKKFCDRLTSAVNEEENLDTSGFPNAMERVLTELGFGGAKGLQDYYQCRVVNYVTVLEKRCQELDKYYSALILPKNESPNSDVEKLYKMDVKEEQDDEEIVSSTSFPDGYQLIDLLEADARFGRVSSLILIKMLINQFVFLLLFSCYLT
ncbi:uncharacterized protein LOC143196650 isoform X2 [Rhynchophorus ferrugineus]|uniref:uncharacterized protein LOC143196650 isoform X2 n=1 Tax=Rhynchophorus ferrugineus TaxID=354439 RepID=UPI003FCD896A